MCLLAIWMATSLKKCLFRSYTHFLHWVVFQYWAIWTVCVFWKLNMSVALFSNNFSHSISDLFTLFMVSFVVKKNLSLIRPNFAFISFTLGCCCCSVTQLYPTLCDPRNAVHQASLSFSISCSLNKLIPIGLMMPSNHIILSPFSPPALSLSQHQGLFQWVRSSHQVAKVLEFHLQHQSFQWIFRTDFL